MFEFDPETITRISQDRVKLIQMDQNSTRQDAKQPLYSLRPAMDREVIQFINFARSQDLPVPLSQIKHGTLLTAGRLSKSGFSTSNERVQNYRRRSLVQPSCRLHGQASVSLPAGNEENVAAIRELCRSWIQVPSGAWMNLSCSIAWAHVVYIWWPKRVKIIRVVICSRSISSVSPSFLLSMQMQATNYQCLLSDLLNLQLTSVYNVSGIWNILTTRSRMDYG